MGEKIQIGTVGLERLEVEHARALALHISGVEHRALCGLNEKQLCKAAWELDVSRTDTGCRRGRADPDLDAVVIVFPFALHPVQTIAWETGKYFFNEKPLDITVPHRKRTEQAEQMHPDSDPGPGIMRRFDKLNGIAKAEHDAGENGRTALVRFARRSASFRIRASITTACVSGPLMETMRAAYGRWADDSPTGSPAHRPAGTTPAA